jgi:predicted XRE-type DNA-binding protein
VIREAEEASQAFRDQIQEAARAMWLDAKIRQWPCYPVPLILQRFSRVVLDEAWRRIASSRGRAQRMSELDLNLSDAMIIQWMRETGLSQSEWAKLIPISQSALSVWWRDGRIPRNRRGRIFMILNSGHSDTRVI